MAQSALEELVRPASRSMVLAGKDDLQYESVMMGPTGGSQLLQRDAVRGMLMLMLMLVLVLVLLLVLLPVLLLLPLPLAATDSACSQDNNVIPPPVGLSDSVELADDEVTMVLVLVVLVVLLLLAVLVLTLSLLSPPQVELDMTGYQMGSKMGTIYATSLANMFAQGVRITVLKLRANGT